MMVDLPAPDGPNSTVTPGVGDLERDVHLVSRESGGRQTTRLIRQAHRPSAAFSRLPNHSDSSSPISASVSETSDSFAAVASPPGTCSAA